MQERDILLRICVLADIPTLGILSRTSLWSVMREFVSGQYFWLLRVRALMYREVQDRPNSCWKDTYYALEDCIEDDARQPIGRSEDEYLRTGRFTLRVIEDRTALLVLLEMGTIPNYTALDLAIEAGDIELTKAILLNLKDRRDHSDNYSLSLAAERGHVDLFSFLLEEMKTHPEYLIEYDKALESAIISGSLEMVDRVLEEEETNPTEDDLLAIESVIRSKKIRQTDSSLNDGNVRRWEFL